MMRKYENLRLEALKMSAGAAAIGAALILRPDDAMAAALVLPATVTAGGARWFVSNNTFATTGAAGSGLGLTEASIIAPNKTDAYDGAFIMSVNGTIFKDPTGTVDLTGTTLTSNTRVMAGLTVGEQFFFDPATPTVRAVYSYTNPSGAPITATIQWGHNLGSDANTIIVTTSSGDNILTVADRWLITAPAPPPAPVQNDPTLSFVRYGPGTVLMPSSTPLTPGPNDKYADQYTVTVPAGQTRRLMFFGQLSQNNPSAIASIGTFNSNATLQSAGLLAGLTAQQQSEIVNWSLTAVTQPPVIPTMAPLGLAVFAVLLGGMALKFFKWPLRTW